jgi:hypothetical protein
MLIPVSMAQASQRQQAAEQYAQVGTNLTLSDVTGAERATNTTPRTYRELMDLLKCYCFFLQRMLGARSKEQPLPGSQGHHQDLGEKEAGV